MSRKANQTDGKDAPGCAVVAAAQARLRASSHTSLRTVSCKFDQGVLTLDGHLGSFFQKQLAQEVVADMDGVVQVVNRIEVAGAGGSRIRRSITFAPGH